MPWPVKYVNIQGICSDQSNMLVVKEQAVASKKMSILKEQAVTSKKMSIVKEQAVASKKM